jgi:hypothetical protein
MSICFRPAVSCEKPAFVQARIAETTKRRAMGEQKRIEPTSSGDAEEFNSKNGTRFRSDGFWFIDNDAGYRIELSFR